MRKFIVGFSGMVALATVGSVSFAQPAPVPPVVLGRVRAVPEQGTDVSRQILSRAVAGYQACAATAWQTVPTAAGTMSVTFQTGPNGEVATIRGGRGAPVTAAPALRGCIFEVTRRLRFPASVQGVLDVTFSLTFNPPGGAAAPPPAAPGAAPAAPPPAAPPPAAPAPAAR